MGQISGPAGGGKGRVGVFSLNLLHPRQIGLEWDDPSRGKHNGSYKGHSYFQTTHPTSGSFVKASKVAVGLTMLEALRERYAPAAADGEDELQAGVKVVLVGRERYGEELSQLNLLSNVCLNGGTVASAGAKGELSTHAHGLEDVDISESLFTAWSEPILIAQELPRLKALRLNRIPFEPLTKDIVFGQSFANIRYLALNTTGVTWDQMTGLSPVMPSLEELFLCFNKIDSIAVNAAGHFPRLKFLNLEGNRIRRWDDVEKLGHLPSLENLIVNDNLIEEIVQPELSCTLYKTDATPFASLGALSISGNPLKSWASVDALDRIPKLRRLRLDDDPLKQLTERDLRMAIIARIARLEHLNSSAVRPRERVEAERWWLAWVVQHHGLAVDPALFPRLPHLVQIHGEPAKATVTHTLSKDLQSVLLISHVEGEFGIPSQVTRRLPGTMTILNLKRLVKRLFKVDALSQQLEYRGADGRKEVLGDDHMTLHAYGFDAGGEIHVSEEVLAESGDEELLKRVDKQEREADAMRSVVRDQVDAEKRGVLAANFS